jgi:hypothetical protein
MKKNETGRFRVVLHYCILLLVFCGALALLGYWSANPQAQKKTAVEVIAGNQPMISEKSAGKLKEIPQMVNSTKNAGAIFERRELFEPSARRVADDTQLRKLLNDGVTFNLNRTAVGRIIKEDVKYLTLPLPTANGSSVELELVKVDILAPGFTVQTSKPHNEKLDDSFGVHYRGKVKGNDRSLVAVSVFRNEVLGFYSTEEEGNIVLGRLGGKNTDDRHVLYQDRSMKEKPDFYCDTPDEQGATLPTSILQEPDEILARCIKVYIETGHDLFLNKGSVAAVTSYVTGLFNQSATLYANDGVPVQISQIFVWDTPSPYTGTTSLQQLQQFKALRTTFNGNLAHLLTLQSSFGGIAYRPGICNTGFNYAFSGINPNFSVVPTYSWSVMVFTHEMGHNMGSHHTHACVWNGNSTAIDSCATVEGGCAAPGIPGGGGTIMSYCHLQNVGINLSLGFGTQPRNVVVNSLNNGACITDCAVAGRTPFDFDGDSKADVSVFRSSNGGWYLLQSLNGSTGVAFGQVGDRIVPADYDGDGKTDVAVFRGGTWYLNRSQLGFTGITFGAADDIPVPADYDGDGKADVAVFRPNNGGWYLLRSQLGFTAVSFGQLGDRPVAADYDGDGKADVAVNRGGTWYIQRSQLGFTGAAFGDGADKLVPADYDGDGKADIAVFRPSNGGWYILKSTGGTSSAAFGLSTDQPAPADFDGDGKADIAVYRLGTWYIQRTQLGFTGIGYGAPTDLAVTNAFVR